MGRTAWIGGVGVLVLGCNGNMRAVSQDASSSRDASASDDGSVPRVDGAFPADVTSIERPDTGPLVPVADCSALPAVGEWQDITPPAWASEPGMESLAIVVDPYDQSIYAAAGNVTHPDAVVRQGTAVYRSTDCGATWRAVTTGENGDKLRTGDPWALLIDPHPGSPPTLYIDNGYGNDPTIYKSTNGGVDFTELNPDPDNLVGVVQVEGQPDRPDGAIPFVQALAMDPGDSSHIAVTFHSNCIAPRRSCCLSRSHDGGVTWELFDGPPTLGGWEEAASLSIAGADGYILLGPSGVWYTGDAGGSWAPLGGGIYASYAGSTYYHPDGRLFASFGGLRVSEASSGSPLGSTWTAIGAGPSASALISDGVRLFASYSWDSSGQPFQAASLDDLGHWSAIPSPHIERGANQMAYDPVHHIVYGANWGSGLWRMVSRE